MIRSLTIGLPVGAKATVEIDAGARDLLAKAGDTLGAAGLAPRTTRYTLPAVGMEGESEGVIHSTLRWVDGLAADTDVRWFCLPLDFSGDGPRDVRLAAALDVIGRFPRLFLNLIVASETTLCAPAIHDASALIGRIARKSNNGFDNFRVGMSCGCPANTPFFPYSRHEGEEIAFSFALETTGLAAAAADELGAAISIDTYRDRLTGRLAATLRQIDALGREISRQTGHVYAGLDSSFAPFPNGDSVAGLIERLLGSPVGSHGSVFITSVLTDAIRAALQESGARAVGFNGVMFSVLEDNVLAKASSRRNISVDTLLALSTVCGCGIDMVPVAGTTFPEEIAALAFDTAALALALRKPLGVRVLPIPNRAANESTEFNLDFLCDGRVIELQAYDSRIAAVRPLFSYTAPRDNAPPARGK